MAYLREIKVTYQRKRVKDDLLSKKVDTPKQVFELFQDMQDEGKEKVVCLHLNNEMKILSYEMVGLGSSHAVLFDVFGTYRGAIVMNAGAVIIVHNHPLGTCQPSDADKNVANALAEFGQKGGIPLFDFIIIGEDGYFSFEEKGLLKK